MKYVRIIYGFLNLQCGVSMTMNKLSIFVLSMFLVCSSAPAFAGKDKTRSAWASAYADVSGSVSDADALAQLSILNQKMIDGYGNIPRLFFYDLASEMFEKAIDITQAHGGKEISKTDWLD